MGYGSISALTYSVYIVGMSDGASGLDVDAPISGPRFAIDFNGYGFIGLGVSLIIQGAISSWCLSKSKIVPTWSSNPFTTTLVCKILGFADQTRSDLSKVSSPTAMISAKDIPTRVDTCSTWLTAGKSGRGIILALPQKNQLPMRTEVPHSPRAAYCIWTVFAIVVLWIVLVAAFGSKSGSCTKEYVDMMNYRTDFLAYWQSYCQVGLPYYLNPYFNRRDWLGLIIQCLAFAVISVSLHCGELLTDIARDESTWRKATTTGADAGRGVLLEGATS
jgi:hypothetical protein